MPRTATDAEVEDLAQGTVVVALSGRRGRPLQELLLEDGKRILPVYRSRASLNDAAAELPLDVDGGGPQGVAVDAVHALAHLDVAKLDGLVIDAGLLGSAFVPAAVARRAVAERNKRPSRPPAAPAPVPPEAGPAPEAGPPRVVVVDDDPLVLRALERFLSMHGLVVHCVAAPLEAAAVVYMHRATVLVLDVLMPGADGERVWDLLRAATATPPRVVFYSGIGVRELERIARGDPYVDRVSKEDGPEALLAAIRRAHEKGLAR